MKVVGRFVFTIKDSSLPDDVGFSHEEKDLVVRQYSYRAVACEILSDDGSEEDAKRTVTLGNIWLES